MKSLIVWACCLACSTAVAQDAGEVSPWNRPRLHDWTLSFEARAWYQAPAGDLTLPGGVTPDDEIELDELNMDSPRLSPYGELRVQRGKLRLGIGGSFFSAEKGSTIETTRTLGDVDVYEGERTRLDFSHWSMDALALYELFSYVDGSTADGRDEVRIRGSLGGGLRVSGVDFDFSVDPTDPSRTGGEVLTRGYDGTFVELLAAGALDIDLYERWYLSVEASGGAFGLDDRTSASFSIEPTLAWHPGSRVGVEVGYRLLIHRMEDGESPGEFEWSGSMAGLFAGLSVRF